MLLVLLPYPAQAQEPVEEAVWELGESRGGETISDTLQLQGYRPTVEWPFILPAGWEAADEGELILNYETSTLLRNPAVTIHLNDRPVATFQPTIGSGSEQVTLPAELLQPGENRLSISALLPLEEDEQCIIPNHPARWLTVTPESTLALALRQSDELYLSDLPAHLTTLGNLDAPPLRFFIPDDPTSGELAALSSLAVLLASDENITDAWSIVPVSQAPDSFAGPAIVLGTPTSNPLLAPLAPDMGGAGGWLHLEQQEWAGGWPVLVVGGTTGADVQQAAAALLDPLARLQMAQRTAVVGALDIPGLPELPERITLEELGYGERTAQQGADNSLLYSFALPMVWSPRDGQITLNFVHSANVDPNLASMTALVNGRRLAGVRLDAPGSSANQVQLAIPQQLLRPGRNFLRLTFDFGSAESACGFGGLEGPWATVRPDSFMILPHGDLGGRLTLDDLPYTFASPADANSLRLVLPSDHTAADLEGALQVLRALALPHGAVAPRIVAAGEAVTNEAHHLILLGPPARQPLLAKVNNYLPLPFDLASGMLLPTYGITLPTEQAELGVVQIARSPWNTTRAVLLLSGTSERGYQQALDLLTIPILQAGLTGQITLAAVGDPSPALYTQHVPDLGRVPGVGNADRLARKWFGTGGRGLTVVLPLVVLVLLAVLIVVGLRWYRQRQAMRQGGH